jgi:hypothetical protein
MLKKMDGLTSDTTSFDAYVFAENKDMIYNVPTPKSAAQDLVPSSSSVAQKIQGQQSATLFSVLFDSGDTNTCINKCCLPQGVTPMLLNNPLQGITAAGWHTANCATLLRDIVLFLNSVHRIKSMQHHLRTRFCSQNWT